MSGPRSVIIVGAGLAGSLLACLLSDRGWRVRVFERRPDPRLRGYLGGRSINLALSVRGLLGLRAAGLDGMVMEREAIRMPGRMLHAVDGATTFQPYSSDPSDAIHSVSRGGLNLALIRAAGGKPAVEFFFDAPCTDVDFASTSAVFERGGCQTRETADLIVGTDGAFSAVRLAMMKTDRFDYAQSYLQHGYKELHIPPNAAGEHAMQPHALHIWPRGGAMMIALPNTDGSFTCTLFWPYEGEHGLHAPRTREQVGAHFAKHYADAVPLMPTLVEDFQRNPTGSLVTVRCMPWRRGNVCLLGDAAHAIVPFYGQGMNAAFEDCVVLARELEHHAGDVPAALAAYERSRKPSADAIADMALDNFLEMRDLAGRADFQYTKKIEQTLHKHFGDALTPQYNLVSFSTVPYELAQRRGREMAGLLGAVAAAVPAPGAFDDAWKRRVVEAAAPLMSTITPIPAGCALTIP